jgi:tetratricopeptide (TPR) repeat protein/lysophospholipase L1-like esterase
LPGLTDSEPGTVGPTDEGLTKASPTLAMPSKLKPVLFRVAAVLIPLLVLLFIEAGLRVAGVAEDSTRPFRRIDGHEDHLILNGRYTQRYFNTFAPGVSFDPFRAVKPDRTFRLFAFGGSTTVGFPNNGYAFPAQLRSRLEMFLPDLRSEVVNLALTATNSYTIRDLSRDVVGYEPDAVLIYAGHNEYYGAFGAGASVNRLGNREWLKRLVIRLKRSVVYTMMERVARWIRPSADVIGRTMMAEAVGEASIPLDGKAFLQGTRQFENNMSEVLRVFCDADVPVYLATLTSNLEGQPPLGENPAAAEAYAAGRRSVDAGEWVTARESFVRAKELDELRFRAPEEMNRAIRRLVEGSCATLVDVSAEFRDASREGIEGDQLFVDHLHPTVAGQDLIARSFFKELLNHPELQERATLSFAEAPPQVDPFDRAASELRISRLTMGYPFVRGFSPKEEADRYRAFVSEFVTRGTVDSLAALSVLGEMSEDDAFAAAIYFSRSRADTTSALLMYRSWLGRRPFNTELAEQAVLFAVDNSRSSALVRDISRMWANRTANLFFVHALTSTSIDLGLMSDADILLGWSMQNDPDSPALLFNRMRRQMASGDTAGSREIAARLRSIYDPGIDPSGQPGSVSIRDILGVEVGDFQALVRRGDVLRRAGRLSVAIESYESALRRKPDDLPLRNNIATVFLQLGDTTEAIARYRDVLEADSTFIESWINLALYYGSTGQVRRANEALGRAMEINPDHPVIKRLRSARSR